MRLRFITQNLGWKLGSLGLAVALWFSTIGEPEVLTSRAVPVLYKNVSPDLLINGDVQDTIRVELRGPSRKLTTGNLADVVALIDVSGVSGPGERTFTVSPAMLNLPENVTFLRAIPSQLRVNLARMLQRNVPVKVHFTGAIPEGYRLTAQQVIPEQLPIAGSEDPVLATKDVETDPINLGGLTQSADFHVNAFVANPRVHLASSPIVTVRITVEKAGKN